MNAHLTHHQKKTALRWTTGIAATVVAGVILAFLVSIARTVVTTKIEQARTAGATQAQISALTTQVLELRQELAGVPALVGRVNKLEAHQDDLQHRVDRLEGRNPG